MSALVVNDKYFVKNLLNKKIIKISPKLTISEIIDGAVGDAVVDDPTEKVLCTDKWKLLRKAVHNHRDLLRSFLIP